MKPRNYAAAFLVVLVMAMLAMPLLLGSFAQTNPPKPGAKQSKDDLKALKASFPVVNYDAAISDDPARKAKGQKYDIMPIINPNATESSRTYTSLDWEVGLPALPIEKSQLIVVGRIADATAHLSANRTSVYSEFNIEIEKIFKNSSNEQLKTGESVSAQRLGGVVRFANGAEEWVVISGQRMPIAQKRYLLFLSYDFPGLAAQQRDFSLLTAYEIHDGYVSPLDNPGGNTHAMAAYEGKSQTDLFADLKKRLSNANRGDLR